MAHNTASPLRALYRIFVLPALSTRTTTVRARPTIQLTRPFSQTSHSHAKTRPVEQRRQRWDSEIKSLQIYLVDPETNTLSEPRTRYDILNNLDTRTHRLIQVSQDEPSNPNFIPVCKIISKKEAYESEKRKKLQAKEAKKVSARGSERGMKTLELNWAIDKGDLEHRLQKLRGFLEEGRRVEVCFRGKKRGRKASLEECERAIGRVREVAGEVEGVKEKVFEGKMGGMASIEFVVIGVKGGGGGGGGASKKEPEREEFDEDEDDDGENDGEEEVEERRA